MPVNVLLPLEPGPFINEPVSKFRPDKLPGLGLWLDASFGVYSDEGVTPATNGQTVRQWIDRSINGAVFSQDTSGSRPSLAAPGYANRPALRFAGAQALRNTGFSVLSAPVTVFVFAGGIENTTLAYIVGSTTAEGQLQLAVNAAAWGFPGIGVVQNGIALRIGRSVSGLTGANLVSYRRTGTGNGDADHTFRYNGVNGFTSENPDNTFIANGMMIGARDIGSGIANGLSGDVSEIIAYRRALSDAEIMQVERYLSRKYSLGIA